MRLVRRGNPGRVTKWLGILNGRAGNQVETAEYAWVLWRSLYVTDPEGNQVELVCYDATV
jgi:hypothetical protein